MNEYFEDGVETPGYREWEAFELRGLLSRFGFVPERNGNWVNREKDFWLTVTYLGLFVGWVDFVGGRPGPMIERLMDVQHLPRGHEERLIEDAILDLQKGRAAASIQCRHCSEMLTPGGIAYERTCWECATEVDGIVF